MFSDRYRSSGKDNSIVLFGILFAPIVLGTFFLTIFQVIPLVLGVLIMIEMAIIGYLNGSIHDDMHLFVLFGAAFGFFVNWCIFIISLHLNVRSNLGIFYFGWDKIRDLCKE